MKNKEIKNQLHELSLVMKAKTKKTNPPKHGFGTHEEIIPVHTKTGKIAMQKRKVGITKKKAPASKKKAPKPKVKTNKTKKLPISGTSEYPYHLMKKNEFGQTIYPLYRLDGYPILPPEHEHKGSFEEKYGDNENYQSNITKHSLRSDKNLDFGYKVKNPPLWLEKALKVITPESLGFYTNEAYNHGGTENMLKITKLHPERTRKLKAFFEYAIPLFKENKIPYTFMLEQPYGRNYFNKELNRTMSSDHWIARNIEPKDLNDAYLVDPDNKEAGLKKIRKPKGSNDHMDWRTLFVQKLVIYIDSKHFPKAKALMDKQQIPPLKIPEGWKDQGDPNIAAENYEARKLQIGKNHIVSNSDLDNPKDKVKKHPIWLEEALKSIPNTVVDETNPIRRSDAIINYSIPLLKKNKIPFSLVIQDKDPVYDEKLKKDVYIVRNITKDDLKSARLKNPKTTIKEGGNPSEWVNSNRGTMMFLHNLRIFVDKKYLPKAKALMDKQQIPQTTKPIKNPEASLDYKKGTKTENTARRKKLAIVLGLKNKAPFKNWIKQSKELKEAKTDYFGFNDKELNPIGEAKEQKIGWNNLILDKNLKKADRIFLAPIDPYTKEIGIKGHTPYSDVLVANSTTQLYKLGVENGISNMGYGVFIIDTKNKTIEKMDIHALNKTTLEEAKKESEQSVSDSFFPSKPIETKSNDKVKPTPQIVNNVEKLAERVIGMSIKGKAITEKDSKDFMEKYIKPLSENYRYKEGSTITPEEKSILLEKMLDQGLPESGFRDDSNEDSYIKHLLDKGFIKSEKMGLNQETGHSKHKFVVKPEHKEAISLYNQLLSGK